MDIKLFKGFTTYLNVATKPFQFTRGRIAALDDKMSEREGEDPGLTEWRRIGFQRVDVDDSFLMDMTGAGYLCALAFNERNLPGSVIKEAMLERAADIERREGRKMGKKAFAELKEEVIASLLPQAFIKRKVVPVMFIKNCVVVFSTSAKVCDDVVSMLIGTVGDSDTFVLAMLEHRVDDIIGDRLTTIARDGQSDMCVPGDGDMVDVPFLESSINAVLKGEDKQTITIKDKSVGATDIQELLKQDYHVTKLGVKLWEPEQAEAAASFTLNDKLVVSGMKILDGAEKSSGKDKEDQFNSVAWLTAKAVASVIDCLIMAMGGLKVGTPYTDDFGEEAKAPFDFDIDEGALPEDDDDDEL